MAQHQSPRDYQRYAKEILEIVPLTEEQKELFLRFPELISSGDNDILLDDEDQILIEDLYVVRKVDLPNVEDGYSDLIAEVRKLELNEYPLRTETSKTIEIGVFLDTQAYDNLKKQKLSDEVVNEYILASINQVSVLLAHPSLKLNIAVTIVRLEIFVDEAFECFDGHAIKYYKSFCR